MKEKKDSHKIKKSEDKILEREKLVLIDAHAVLHRSHHALSNFTSPSGEPTGALYGFISFIFKVAKELSPDYLAVCYDLPGGTFRHKSFKEYKAKRPKMDDTLASQIEVSKEALKALNIPAYSASGFEADDILGTIVEQMKRNKNLKIYIASGDMDTLQLVDDDRVVVYTLKKGIQEAIIYDENAVLERYGFGPEHIIDFKGLKGDPSDNIPGVSGVGDKTATDILKKYGTIESLYEFLRNEEKEIKTRKAKVSSSAEKNFPASLRIKNLLLESEEEALFSKSLATIRRDAPVIFSLEDSRWPHGIDRENLEKIFHQYGMKSLSAKLNFFIGEKKDAETLKEKTKGKPISLFDGTEEKKVSNLEEKIISSGDEIREKFGQTVTEKFLIEVEIPLDAILKKMTRHGVILDIKYLKELSLECHKKIKKLEKKIFELSGVEPARTTDGVQSGGFNVNSPKQLGEILFEKLYIGEGRVKMTSTGNYSTDNSQLLKFKDEHEIIPFVIEHREVSKLISTYIDAFPKIVDGENRLHTTYDSAGAATGRLSSSNPNLQNIPIRSELGGRIRRAFVSPKNRFLLTTDYSQIELRVLAILSHDKKLTEVFKAGEDVHTQVAREVFGVSKKEITPEMRRRAKIINFGIIYGMGVNALKASLGCEMKEARAFYDNYFRQFPTIKNYFDELKREAYKKGYTETLFGRKRFFPDIRSHIPYLRAATERTAMNAPIQGTAADFIKIAMVEIDKALEKKKLSMHADLILQIHDELVYEVEEDYLKEVAEIVLDGMKNVWKGEVPIEASVKFGRNLAELENL